MPKKKITIEVPEEVAQAYEKASAGKRKRAERAMAVALTSQEELAATFRKITRRASEYAATQGLTEEKLDELLREDDE